jgi:hypothetical protein
MDSKFLTSASKSKLKVPIPRIEPRPLTLRSLDGWVGRHSPFPLVDTRKVDIFIYRVVPTTVVARGFFNNEVSGKICSIMTGCEL